MLVHRAFTPGAVENLPERINDAALNGLRPAAPPDAIHRRKGLRGTSRPNENPPQPTFSNPAGQFDR
jgi:hypothetical protein